MILTGLTACDNVSWGGVELRLETPASTDTAVAVADTAAEEQAPPPLELDPVLFTVERSEDTLRLVPVAVLGREGLRSFPSGEDVQNFSTRFQDERMSPDRRFVLFSGGRRVGTFYTRAVGEVDRTYCVPRPTALGRVELLPEAMEVDRFLALPIEIGERYPHSDFERAASTRAQRAASLNMAAALFATMEIRWPPSILEARADLQIFQPVGSESELVAATFLYGDSLAVGDAPENAYSLFFLGEPSDGDYDPTYVRYREVGVDGKAAARFVDHLDWDRDGAEDVLLEVYGTGNRWFAGVERTAAEWVETFREDCTETSAADVALGDSTELLGRPERAGDPAP